VTEQEVIPLRPILERARLALDFIGIKYRIEWDMIELRDGGQIWTENGDNLKTSPNGALVYLNAIIKKMEVGNE
jgi:hypothetical protein